MARDQGRASGRRAATGCRAPRAPEQAIAKSTVARNGDQQDQKISRQRLHRALSEINRRNDMAGEGFKQVCDEVVSEAAAFCARKLAKLYGGIDEAIAALEADPVDLADLAMRDFIKDRRQMTLKVHMNPQAFSRQIFNLIK